jgi:HK97 family phage prohead protease
MKHERRYLTQEFRVSQGDNPTINGYAAVFNTASDDMGWTEEIDPHAFDAVMATNPDTRALWNHNPDHVLGRVSAGTLTLTIDSRGLAYTITPPDTTVARDLLVSMRRKDVRESSFGFICRRDQCTDNADGSVTRRILEIAELFDVSPVTYPAYSDASASVRSLPDSMPVEIRSRFERRSDDPKTKRVDGEDLSVSSDEKSLRSLTDQCTCPCAQCLAGSCGICSSAPQCMGAERSKRSASSWHDNAMLRLRIAEAS